MRIALCTQYLSDMTSLNILGSLARELSQREHTPFFYTNHTSSHIGNTDFNLKSLRVLKCPVRHLPGRDPRVMTRTLAETLQKDKIDLIYLRLGGAHRNPFIGSLSTLLQLKFLPRLSLQFDDFGNPDLPADCPHTARTLRQLMVGSHSVSAVSRAVRDRVRCYWPAEPRRIQVIGNGVDLSWFGRPKKQQPPGPKPYILSIGRQARYKGMDLLVFAFAGIAAEFPMNLVIAGPDMGADYLWQLVHKLGIENRVQLAGFAEHRQLPRLLNGAEFFVLASRWESFGIAALEAMAAGKAVIAPRVGGFVDYIKDRRTGRLFSPGDIDALTSAMRQLLLRPAEARSLGAAAREAARSHSWSAVTSRYLGLWSSASPE